MPQKRAGRVLLPGLAASRIIAETGGPAGAARERHMGYRLLADLLVLLHAAFVLFVVGGGLLVLRWPRLARCHLPAAVWGVLIELFHWGCPLTRLENYARRRGGEAGYPGGFIDHYIMPVLYPEGLTPRIQVVLGLLLLVFNLLVYARLWTLRRRSLRREGDRAR